MCEVFVKYVYKTPISCVEVTYFWAFSISDHDFIVFVWHGGSGDLKIRRRSRKSSYSEPENKKLPDSNVNVLLGVTLKRNQQRAQAERAVKSQHKVNVLFFTSTLIYIKLKV